MESYDPWRTATAKALSWVNTDTKIRKCGQAKINIEKLFLIAFHLAIAHLNMQELMNILIRVARRLITMKKGRMGRYYVRLGFLPRLGPDPTGWTPALTQRVGRAGARGLPLRFTFK
jgi:hypothetical protein